MKKILLTLIFGFAMLLPVLAQDSDSKKPIWDHGDNVSDISYENVTIYKVFDSKDAYVVLYAKKGIDIGKVTIPKSWAKESPRKLAIRKQPAGMNPYMTVINKGGEFLKVWLTLPVNRKDEIWAVLPAGSKVEGADATTLQLQY